MASSWDSSAWFDGRSGRLLRAGLSSRAGSNVLQKRAGSKPPLTFTELEPLTGASHAVLLALLRAGIAREQSFLLQARAILGVDFAERARDAETNGAGLAGDAAAGDGAEHVELVGILGQHQRLHELHPQ